MKDSLQLQLKAMDNKVDEVLRGCEPQQDVTSAQPDTTSQQDTSTAIPETTPQPDVTEVSMCSVLDGTIREKMIIHSHAIIAID